MHFIDFVKNVAHIMYFCLFTDYDYGALGQEVEKLVGASCWSKEALAETKFTAPFSAVVSALANAGIHQKSTAPSAA